MEHCSNGELFDYISSKNRVKEEEACRLFQQLIAAIEYIGELGIAHRDIKPENILLDDSKNIKLLDFGLSNTYNQGERLVTACGSPCYAAPELIKGKEYLGQKADIWSAGVVLYTTVCGYLPFEDQNTQSLYQKILKADFQYPSFLQKDVRDLITHILVPDPDLRFGLKQIKQHRWLNIYQSMTAVPKGFKVGFDDFPIHEKLLKELYDSNQINPKYVKHCLQANRHNYVTAHYFLLLKQKIANGDNYSEGLNDQQETINREPITASYQIRTHKSIAAPRTTKFAQNHQLRKIAEGLGNIQMAQVHHDPKDSRTNRDSHVSQLKQNQQSEIIKRSASKYQSYRGGKTVNSTLTSDFFPSNVATKIKSKRLNITAPSIDYPNLPPQEDYVSMQSTLTKNKETNKSIEKYIMNMQLAQSIMNQSLAFNTSSSQIPQKENRIRIKTNFKINPSRKGLSGLNTSTYGASNNSARFQSFRRMSRRGKSLNKGDSLRIEGNTQFPQQPNITSFLSTRNRKLSVVNNKNSNKTKLSVL